MIGKDDKSFLGVAMIVDINEYTKMVQNDDSTVAQFVRDCLIGAVTSIEDNGGEVVGFMGDAVLGIFESTSQFLGACWAIAKDVDRHCEYISACQSDDSNSWAFSPGGPSLKISGEFGRITTSAISSNFLGEQIIFVGTAINCAARIAGEGVGNRCHVGPRLAEKIVAEGYGVGEGRRLIGKNPDEGGYIYHQFDLGHIWIEGERVPGKDTFWG